MYAYTQVFLFIFENSSQEYSGIFLHITTVVNLLGFVVGGPCLFAHSGRKRLLHYVENFSLNEGISIGPKN